MRIKLKSGGLFPTYLIVTTRHIDDNGWWDVTDIEIYSRPDCQLDSLIADDVWGRLPPSSQHSIYSALNEWNMERRKEKREVRQIMEGM